MKREQIIKAIERGKNTVKRIEASQIPKDKRRDSAWLNAINDIIDRVGLSILDQLEIDNE